MESKKPNELKTALPWRLVGTCSALHFLVDALCLCALYCMVSAAAVPQPLLYAFIAYNVLAFLTQPLTGMMADRVTATRLWMLLGWAVALLALGTAVALFTTAASKANIAAVLTAAVLLGLGNSLFHVWGGKAAAVATGCDPRALGLFVAPGALGLAVGMMLHSWWLAVVLLMLIVMLAAVAFRLPTRFATANIIRCKDLGASVSFAGLGSRRGVAWGVLLVLMALVTMRSFIGESLTAGLDKGTSALIIAGAVAALGKAVGGWPARRHLVLTVILIAAGLTLCLSLKGSAQWLWLPGLLLVNMTMAVTLWLADVSMTGREGLAFGLLAAALMPGYLLAQTGLGDMGAFAMLLLPTLLPTIAIELLVLWTLREHRADVLWASVVVNTMTNVPLNLYLTFVAYTPASLLCGELIVVLVETLWYRYFVDNTRRAVAYSVLCNGISFLCGLLLLFLSMLVENYL